MFITEIKPVFKYHAFFALSTSGNIQIDNLIITEKAKHERA